jgi:hypothetical protein
MIENLNNDLNVDVKEVDNDVNDVKEDDLGCHELDIDLKESTITFGKYKNKMLSDVLKDRSYCRWLVKQEWFINNYEFLYNRVVEYNPLSYFIENTCGIVNERTEIENMTVDLCDFLSSYKYFMLKSVCDIKLVLTDDEKKCYSYYLEMVSELKKKIQYRIVTGEENYL